MYQTLFIFFTYAILGWCLEVAFHALVTGKFINRGFLNGPWCPVYGFGASAVLACLLPLRGSVPLLFLGSLLVTSALEWLTGFVLEQLFHQRWWDYSDEPFNLNGYICLRFSLAWGLACLLVVDFIHPTVLWEDTDARIQDTYQSGGSEAGRLQAGRQDRADCIFCL